jgi:methylated-DNA-protein-cysteine methyltransferase related protein
MNGFFQQVYELVKQVPAGKVTTYGEIAASLGSRDSRRVGWALHANRSAAIPCHRVVTKEGKLAANFAFEGGAEQRRRLEAEGVEFADEIHVNMPKHRYSFEGGAGRRKPTNER